MLALDKTSKAFSDKNRLKILEFLSSGQKNVSEVAEKLNVEENLASHHLRVLTTLGYLRNDKKGREVFYRVNDAKVLALLKDLMKNPSFKDLVLKALKEDTE